MGKAYRRGNWACSITATPNNFVCKKRKENGWQSSKQIDGNHRRRGTTRAFSL